MAIQNVTYLTKAFLACSACPPAEVIIQLEAEVVVTPICFQELPVVALPHVWQYQTILGQITASVKRGNDYEYTIAYEADDITTPTLDPADIKGLACVGPLATYVRDLIGGDAFVTSNDDGTYTFHSNHGCEYIFRGVGVDNLIVTDTDSVDLSLTEEFGLQAYVRISPDVGNALQVLPNGLFATSGWAILGNSGTIDGTNFLGTTDNVPFTIRANNKRVLKVIPGAASPSFLGGFEGNVLSLSEGSIIATGGYAGRLNQLTSSNYAVIAGGENNIIQEGLGSVIGGGASNQITASTQYATISGGTLNTIGGDYGTIAGGKSNGFDGLTEYGFIGGGDSNHVGSNYGVLVGGINNHIYHTSTAAFIGGGANNVITLGNDAVIVGGNANALFGFRSFIGGGYNNSIGTLIDDADYSIVLGGESNGIGGGANHSVILSGRNNRIQTTGALGMVIGGGDVNLIEAAMSFIGSGSNQIISSQFSFIGSGTFHIINFASNYASVVGGRQNRIYGSNEAFIGGGSLSTINDSPGSVIVGGAGVTFVNAGYSASVSASTTTITHSDYGFVGTGNLQNLLYANGSFIGAGRAHTITAAQYSAIVSGNTNTINATPGVNNSDNSFIGGGTLNEINVASRSVIGGGDNNKIRINAMAGVIAGGFFNFIGNESQYCAILGGANSGFENDGCSFSMIGAGNFLRLTDSTLSAIVSGSQNNITQQDNSIIAGGRDNTISSVTGTAGGHGFCFIGSGRNNTVSSDVSSIVGGQYNQVMLSYASAILGGQYNLISYVESSAILGGRYNAIVSGETQGRGSTILGGSNLTIGPDAVGFQSAVHFAPGVDGARVWLVDHSSLFYVGNCDIWCGNSTNDENNNAGIRLYGKQSDVFPQPKTFVSPFVEYVKLRSNSPVQSYSITWPDTVPTPLGLQILKVTGVNTVNGIPNVQLYWADDL